MTKIARRKLVVLGSLVGVLSLTSALLLCLAPPPLAGESSYNNLWATDGADNNLTDDLFQTRVPAEQGHWKSLYIHQGAAFTGEDHFIIGNGYGVGDGQIQMTQRWMNQTPASPPAGASRIDPDCISICVIGDFMTAAPSANQTRRLAELVNTLQGQLGIGGDKVYFLSNVASPAGVGKFFPADWLRKQILP